MNKNRKQNHGTSSTPDKTGTSIIRIVLLAFIPCIAQIGPALAEVQMGDVTFPIQDSSTAQDSVLTDNINVELLSIALPAGGLKFTMSTLREFSLDSPGGQLRDMGPPVMNCPKMSIQIKISQVAGVTRGDLHLKDKLSDQEKQSFRLVGQISKVDPMETAILVLGAFGQTYSTAQRLERWAFLLGGTGSIYITEILAEGTVHLKLYGKMAPDFYGQYQFTVRSTLEIGTAG